MEQDPKQLSERGNVSVSLSYFLERGFPKNTKVLDIGCNFGTFMNSMYQAGYSDIWGVEINPKALAEGQRSYPHLAPRLLPYNGWELPFENNSLDVITMFDVIEHIPNVDRYLHDQVFRCLKPGGSFVFQTPNKYQNIIWEVIHRRSLTRWREYHISLQTPGSLHRILAQAGFENIVLEKQNIDVDYNRRKVRKALGSLGIVLLKFAAKLPLQLGTNLWGYATKPTAGN